MKIVRYYIPVVPLDKFADDNGLVMEIHERDYPVGHPLRFRASFAGVEIARGMHMLCSLSGNGCTPENAMEDYAKDLSLRTLVVNAMGPDRREIKAPRLSPPTLCERPEKI
jgi:hypothetical protein